jgi:hypothetical protein
VRGGMCLAACVGLNLLPAAWAAEPDLFTRQVAPLLRDRCISCHNTIKKRGGLDLTSRPALARGSANGPVIQSGNSAKSLLLEVLTGLKPRMPKSGEKLTAAEVDAIRRWIDAGAPWPDRLTLAEPNTATSDWWSLRPLARPTLPALAQKAGGQNPVDAFVRATLAKQGMSPSPEADRRTLLRRVTFDLHGLPPTPEEIDGFEHDMRPDAWQRVVDRLLASPRYGERWGRHWLDVVHYGDTHGYDKDKRRDFAWRYRDYVIRSFNSDKPYDRFVREQLAGDVLYPGDADGVAATGFIAAGPWDFVGNVELREGTVDKEKTRSLDRDDMVSTVATTFLSLTVGCARCHDHKFDPIPQADYYRLQAVFAGVERADRPCPPEAAEMANKARIDVEMRQTKGHRSKLLERARDVTSPALTRLDRELRDARARLSTLEPTRPAESSPTNGYHSGIMSAADVVKWVQVDLGKSLPIEEVRLIPARPTDYADTPGFGFPVRFRVETCDTADFGAPHGLADFTAADYANPGDSPVRIRGTGIVARFVRVTATRLWRRSGDYVFALAEMQVDSAGINVANHKTVTARDSIEAGRWSVRNLVDGFSSRVRLPDLTNPKVAADYHARVDLQQTIHDLEAKRQATADSLISAELRAELVQNEIRLKALNAEEKAIEAKAKVYAVRSIPARPIHVLNRGDVEQPRALVAAGGLSCLAGVNSSFTVADADPEGSRRVALAAWITDQRNPLTWRSAANRIWHYHFGRGIVDTPSDFGRNGSRPTHPELLDWLAYELRDNDGSFKALHRLILTSATYRQVSTNDAAAAKVDADNRYLWRMNRTRLDAEEVRDAVLAISGKLAWTMGGPGFELFRFKDDHSPIYDHSALEKIHDPATYRRTVYRFTVRSVPNPLLDALDCADPNINTPVRNTTLTAVQALALLNDPFLIRQSEYFAARLGHAGDPGQRIDLAYRLTLGRLPVCEERTALAAFAARHGLANACRLLFNLNEFVFVD